MRALALALLLAALPLTALASGDDDDSAACDDDDSADTTPDDATTYGFLCGVAPPGGVPSAPGLLVMAGLVWGVARRR